MENLNRGRQTPGMENLRTEIPKRNTGPTCPFGNDCKACMIAINMKEGIKCSISILAAEALKTGIKIGEK